MIESLASNLEQTLDSTKEQVTKWENSIDDIPMPDIEQHNMSLEEAKLAFKDTFEEGIDELKLTAEEVSTVSSEVYQYIEEFILELQYKLGIKERPYFDYAAIGKSAAISAVAGGVLGSLAGAIAGGVGGAVGEILSQFAKHIGASDGVAMLIQIGTELFTAGGIVKLAGKGISKLAVNSVDDVAVLAKNKGGDIISKTNVIDDLSIHSKDTLVGKIKEVNPNIVEGRINLIKGEISENMMDKYFKNSGWSKIEGEVGRNGIDGLYIRKDANSIKVLMAESKYNTSKLGETLHGVQMSPKWIMKKLDNLIEAFPDNKDYVVVKKLVENGQYRSRLFQLKEMGDNLQIKISNIIPKGHDNINILDLAGRESSKINKFQNIDLKNLSDVYSTKIASLYDKSVVDTLAKSKYIN